jgi:hypothetical protein
VQNTAMIMIIKLWLLYYYYIDINKIFIVMILIYIHLNHSFIFDAFSIYFYQICPNFCCYCDRALILSYLCDGDFVYFAYPSILNHRDSWHLFQTSSFFIKFVMDLQQLMMLKHLQIFIFFSRLHLDLHSNWEQ